MPSFRPHIDSDDRTHPSLILRLRDSADAVSWEQFERRYGHLLYRYARARGARHADAQDVVQDVLAQVVRVMPSFEYDRLRGGLRAYLRVAVLRAMGRRAQLADRQPRPLDPATCDQVSQDDGPDALWDNEWHLQRLRQALTAIADDIEPTALKAFELHVLAGRAVAETARMLDVSIWTVYRARARILARLKAELHRAGDGDG